MIKFYLSLAYLCCAATLLAQPFAFTEVQIAKATPVKSQAATGTCWSFAMTSLIESETLRKTGKEVDLSEMFYVRHIYVEKARNYLLRGGMAQFDEGALGHDLVRAVALYGAVPEGSYTGLVKGATTHNHGTLVKRLRNYLGGLLRRPPVTPNWMEGYTELLNEHLGVPPDSFSFEGRSFTPKSFAREVLQFDANDYINLTSFTHVPYYAAFVLQVPDNFSNGEYYNLPLSQFVGVVKGAIGNGYSVSWDADVTNKGFKQGVGLALNLADGVAFSKATVPDATEAPADSAMRQALYENLTTRDDHLMHVTGIEKSKGGKTFFVVKNSWGSNGPYSGYIHVSENYFIVNTVSVVLPKAALSEELLQKLR